ncbi:hypothetical protein HDU79_011374, partial [Rhizoclosmatium sp. JEL0117]
AALAVVAEAVAAETNLSEKSDENGKGGKRKIKDAVGRILRAALDAVDPSSEAGDTDSGGFVLFKECHLPAVNQPPTKEDLKGTLKLPFHYPIPGKADFGFGLAQSGSTRSEKGTTKEWEWSDAKDAPFSLPFISPVEVKTSDSIYSGENAETGNNAMLQTASCTVYSMMRVLPYLSDDEKRLIFGDNIVMYGLLLTHKTARLINVSPLNFCMDGKFTVCSSELQSTNGTVMNDPFVKLITGFTFESVRILRHLRKLINRFSAPPLYCWLPVEAYKTIIKERNGPVTYRQTFTNPIIKSGCFYFRIYASAFSKTTFTRVDALDAAFAKQRNSEFVNPFEGWIFARPFMAVPDYGLSLHDILHSNQKATFKMVQNLVQSLTEKSLVPLTTVQYCHMDIRFANICVKDLEGWTDARLIDYDFATVTKGTDLNPMDKSNIQYPKEEIVHILSDIWMVGIVLLKLSQYVDGIGFVLDKSITTHIGIEGWVEERLANALAQAAVNNSVQTELNVNLLRVISGCLKVDPNRRMCLDQIVENVDSWKCN